eukprot:COSAG02_NODE_1335_length_13197_cov_5.830279_11_plen_148_part_00
MALLNEQEKANAVDESVPPATPATSVVSKDKEFSPGKLSADELGQCAKFLAGFQMASNAGATESSPASKPPASQTNSSSAAQGSVVKRLMGIFSRLINDSLNDKQLLAAFAITRGDIVIRDNDEYTDLSLGNWIDDDDSIKESFAIF